jgi:proteasome lid subunit RPN8/RPN11
VKDVVLPEALLAEIRAHAREAYPDECCGFLIGPASASESDPTRRIRALERATNDFEGERRRRFLIRPEEVRTLERRVEERGEAVVGFYHSHPDHPARPSLFDQEHAWPWYSYVVLSVTRGDTPAVGAFELDPDESVFREVGLRVEPRLPPIPSVTGG